MKGPKFFSIEFSRSEALVCSSYFFFRTAVLRKLFDIRFSCKHCNFSSVSVLVKMASKTVTRSIYQRRLLKKAIGGKLFSFSRLEWHSARPPPLTLIFSIFYEVKLGIFFFQFFLFSFQHCSAFQMRFSARPFAYWSSGPGEHCLSSVAMVPFSCHKKLLPLVAFYLFGSCYSFFSS